MYHAYMCTTCRWIDQRCEVGPRIQGMPRLRVHRRHPAAAAFERKCAQRLCVTRTRPGGQAAEVGSSCVRALFLVLQRTWMLRRKDRQQLRVACHQLIPDPCS